MKHIKLYWRLLAVTAIFFVASPTMAQKAQNDALVLRGNVHNIKPITSNPGYVDLEIELDLEFVNIGTKPIIFLQPNHEPLAEIFWPGAISLSLSKLLSKRGDCFSSIWAQSHFPAVSFAPEFREMAKRLDQSSPPPDLTRILKPKESWTWPTTAFLRFYSKTPSSVYSQHDLDWQVIGNIGTPLWMRVNYEVWSLNLQRADKNLRKRLQKRWKNVGMLSITPDLTTEPIELKLYEIKLNDTNAAAPNNSFKRDHAIAFCSSSSCPIRLKTAHAGLVNSSVRRLSSF